MVKSIICLMIAALGVTICGFGKLIALALASFGDVSVIETVVAIFGFATVLAGLVLLDAAAWSRKMRDTPIEEG